MERIGWKVIRQRFPHLSLVCSLFCGWKIHRDHLELFLIVTYEWIASVINSGNIINLAILYVPHMMSHINRERSWQVYFLKSIVCSACSEVRVGVQSMLYVALFPTVIFVFCTLLFWWALSLSIFRSKKPEKPTMFIFSDVELDCIKAWLQNLASCRGTICYLLNANVYQGRI